MAVKITKKKTTTPGEWTLLIEGQEVGVAREIKVSATQRRWELEVHYRDRDWKISETWSIQQGIKELTESIEIEAASPRDLLAQIRARAK